MKPLGKIDQVSSSRYEILKEAVSNAKKSNEKLSRIRHSLAHIMAQAVIERFESDGAVKLGIGPAIKDGFYYDFDLPRLISDEDLEWIESRVKEIVKSNVNFKQSSIQKNDAEKLFKDQPYKLELINLICDGNVDEDGVENSKRPRLDRLSVYQHADFIDLCQGPHVESSSEINPDAIKILSVAGAYWRGNENNPMLSRFYATAWLSEEDLNNHLELLNEKQLRDHRKLGKELELFHFDESAPGMPYWLPNGLIVLNELLNYWREEHHKLGYLEFSAPIINDKKLWEISGHWDHYRENMFLAPKDEDIVYGIKPMNCPNAMVVYNLKLRSYKDLPLRLSDCDVLHRNEKSGTLHGLLRVQKFQQDDAHIFLSEDLVEKEFENIFAIARKFYKIFDMQYSFRLSKRPNKFVGKIEEWKKAENILKSILDKEAGKDGYQIIEGEGAFYGPKIDILMEDSLGRSWQMGTIQLDFQLPERFGCKYIDSDGSRKVPVVIHRVIYGSIDRFIGILLEHTAGNLPVWLSPYQAVILPISDRHNEYARAVESNLKEKNIRCYVDDVNSRINKRLREAILQKIPYMVILGDRELESSSVSIRLRSGEEENDIAMEELVSRIQSDIEHLQ